MTIRLTWKVLALIALMIYYYGNLEATENKKIKEWEKDKDRPDTNTFRYTCPWAPYLVGNNSRCQQTCGKQHAFLRPDTLQLVCFTSVKGANACNRFETVVDDVAQTMCECGMQVRSKGMKEYGITCANIPYQMRALKKYNVSCQESCEHVGIFVTKRRPIYNLEWCHHERDISIFNVVQLRGVLSGVKIENDNRKHKCWCGVANNRSIEPSLRVPVPNVNVREVTLKYDHVGDNTTNQTKRHRRIRDDSRESSSTAQQKLKKRKKHSKSFSSDDENNKNKNKSDSIETNKVEDTKNISDEIKEKLQYACQWPPYLLARTTNLQETCNYICGKHRAFLRPDNLQLICYTSIDNADSAKYYRVVMNNAVQSVCECGMVQKGHVKYHKTYTCENIPFGIKGLKPNNQGSCKTVCDQARIFKTKTRPNKRLEWCHYNANVSIFKEAILEGVVTGTTSNGKFSHKCWCGVSKEKNFQPSYNAPMPEPNKKAVWLGYQRPITNHFVPIKIKPSVQASNFTKILKDNSYLDNANKLQYFGRDNIISPPDAMNEGNQLHPKPYDVENNREYNQSNPYDPRTNIVSNREYNYSNPDDPRTNTVSNRKYNYSNPEDPRTYTVNDNLNTDDQESNNFIKSKSNLLEIENDIISDCMENNFPMEKNQCEKSPSKTKMHKTEPKIRNKIKNIDTSTLLSKYGFLNTQIASRNASTSHTTNEITNTTSINPFSSASLIKNASLNQQFCEHCASTSHTRKKITASNKPDSSASLSKNASLMQQFSEHCASTSHTRKEITNTASNKPDSSASLIKNALLSQQFSAHDASTSHTKNNNVDSDSCALRKETSTKNVQTSMTPSIIVNKNTITNSKINKPQKLIKENTTQNDKMNTHGASRLLDKNRTQIETVTHNASELFLTHTIANNISNNHDANASTSINLIHNNIKTNTPLSGVGQAEFLNKLSHWRRSHTEIMKLVEEKTNLQDNNKNKCQNMGDDYESLFGINAFIGKSNNAIEKTLPLGNKSSPNEKPRTQITEKSKTKNTSSPPLFVVHKPIPKLSKEGELDVDSLRIFDLNIDPNKKINLNDINSNKISAFASTKSNKRSNRKENTAFSSFVHKPVAKLGKEGELKMVNVDPQRIDVPGIRNFSASENRISAFTKTKNHYYKSSSPMVHKPIAKLAKCSDTFFDHSKTININSDKGEKIKHKGDTNDNASEAVNEKKSEATLSILESEKAGKNLQENWIDNKNGEKFGLQIGTPNETELDMFPTSERKNYVSAFKPFIKNKDEANEK